MTGRIERRLLAPAFAALLAPAVWSQDRTAPESDLISGLLGKGQHAEAARQARSALAALDAAGQSESLEAAGFLAQLARALWAGGKVADAETRGSAEQSLAIRQMLLGADHPLVGSSLSDLATVLQLLGDYAGALPLSKRAVAVQRKAHLLPHPDTAAALDALGVIRYRTGDIQGALDNFSEALGIYEKSRGPESLEVAQALSDVGVAEMRLGNSQRAKAAHAHALAIRRKKLGSGHFLVAASLNNLSLVLLDLNDLRGALALQEEAMRIREQQLGPEHPNVANGMNNLGMLRLRAGEYHEAAGLFEKSLAIREKVYGPWHWEVAQSLENLAYGLKGEGKFELALDVDLRSDLIFRNQARYVLRTLSEREATRFLDMRFGLNTALSMAADRLLARPEDLRRVWDAVSRSRALVFDEMVVRKAALSSLYGAEGSAPGSRLNEARKRYAGLLVQASDKTRQGELTEARAGMERIERELAERSLRFRREVVQATAGYDEISASVSSGTALIAYLTYRVDSFSEATRLAAFVLPSGGRPVAVSLGDEKQIEALISAWRREITREAQASGRSSRKNEASCRRAGEALRRRIWDPVAAHLGGAKRVFLVPDAAVNLVNFAALPATGDRYLADTGPLIHLLNTERDMVENLHERPHGDGLLAIGDPDYNLSARSPMRKLVAGGTRSPASACLDLRELRFDRLPGSAAEVSDVVHIWSRTRGGAMVLSGAKATERSFRLAAPGKQVLHLATHGFFFEERCGSRDPSRRQPWQLAGLALAGANERGNAPERGILTAEDVASLNLDGLQWVVLSGCDTGLGRIEPHEGVFGLRRAFQLAGARTVIMSLWPIDDQAGRKWMVELYRGRFERELDTPQSVRYANLRVLRSRRSRHLSTHPFYWAGFVAAGDWR